MAITKKINANGTEISILLQGNENDYICLTDMARYKDKQRTDYIICKAVGVFKYQVKDFFVIICGYVVV